jgi:hypothetical protein
MESFALWLGQTSASAFVQKTLWLIPVLQTIHILSVAMVWSSVGMIELRILGVTRSQTMAQTAHRFVPWIWFGVVVLALTGAVLIIGEPDRSLPNVAFQLKMAALTIAASLTLAFECSVRHYATVWNDNSRARMMTSALAIVALLAWCAVMIFGRWIAYTVVH